MSATDSYAPKATVVTRISGSQVVGLPDSDFSRSGRIASGRGVKGLQGGSDYGSKSLTRFLKPQKAFYNAAYKRALMNAHIKLNVAFATSVLHEKVFLKIDFHTLKKQGRDIA